MSEKSVRYVRCPLYRVLDFLEEKIIIDKILTMFYVNCESLQLNFLKNMYSTSSNVF